MAVPQNFPQIPFLDGFDEHSRQLVMDKMRNISFKTGERLIAEGDAGGAMYIIQRGRVRVTRGGQLLAELTDNNFFGEISLLTDEPRTATVTALEDTQCWVLSRGDFRLLADDPAFRQGLPQAEFLRRMTELAGEK